jgi:hypothetical protein
MRGLAKDGAVAGAGLVVGLLITLRLLIPNGMDPSIFLALGDRSPDQTRYAREHLGPVRTREGLGHDGRFFFPQAVDPWYLQPPRHAAVLDRPVYRAQRMLFPVIASGAGLMAPAFIPWSMLITSLVALCIGAGLAARLASHHGLPRWLGLAVPLNIGLLYEMQVGGAGVLAYTLALGATYGQERGRDGWAAAALVLSALTREVMLAFGLGLVALGWIKDRKIRWLLLLTPFVVTGAWHVYIRIRLAGIEGAGGERGNFSPPFVGFAEAVGSWLEHPAEFVVNAVLVLVVVAFVPLATRSRQGIAWGALPFALLSIFLSANVWAEPFDFTRALAPVFSAAPFVLIGARVGASRAHRRAGHERLSDAADAR